MTHTPYLREEIIARIPRFYCGCLGKAYIAPTFDKGAPEQCTDCAERIISRTEEERYRMGIRLLCQAPVTSVPFHVLTTRTLCKKPLYKCSCGLETTGPLGDGGCMTCGGIMRSTG